MYLANNLKVMTNYLKATANINKDPGSQRCTGQLNIPKCQYCSQISMQFSSYEEKYPADDR